MKNFEIRIECLSEIFSDVGLDATDEQIQQIVKDFSFHIEMEREMDSYQHVGFKEECSKCKLLEYKLEEAAKERDVYKNSVMQRRKARSVWIENDSVMYD